MKPPTPFKPLLLLVLLVAAGGFGHPVMAQEDTCAVNVIHTYMNGRLIPWDSVEVRVGRNVGDEYYLDHSFKMYWPDTILSNCTTGVDEYVQDKEWGLSQNYPNPCQGESSVKLTTRAAGRVKLQVMDLQGRLCCQRTEVLPAGEHQLSVTLPHSGVYFVQAETNEGRKVSKVLCTEGRGSGFDIRVASTSPQLVEKAERGGEGLFNMTDRMIITAYITYNGEVRSNGWIVNYEVEDDFTYENVYSDSLFHFGSINIHFVETDSCNDFSLNGNVYNLLVSSGLCHPFVDYPLGTRITFYDSTFYATREIHFDELNNWFFEGWYKYRYYPSPYPYSNQDYLLICPMDEILPPEEVTSVLNLNGYLRYLCIISCDVLQIGYDNRYEFMIKEE